MPENAPAAQPSTDRMVDYDRNSSAQQAIVSNQHARLRDLVGRLDRAPSEMRIVDYGCGPGTSAITAVRPAIDAYRSRFPDDRIAVCHADQPGNDWNALFALIHGPAGYRSSGDGLRTEAAVGSFYDRMVADDSVSLGTCFTASHWLSTSVRLRAPGSLWFADLTGDARRALADQARRDWTRFLRVRSDELRQGGFLLVSTLGSVPDPTEVNGAAAAGRGVYRALQAAAQEMVDDGVLDGDALDEFVFALWFMTADEARSPLQDDEHLAAVYEIELVEVTPAPKDPSDLFAGLISDPIAYGDAYAGYIRAFADSTLRTQLLAPAARSAEHADELATELYRRLHDLYRNRLDEFAFEIWNLTVVLRRR